jgi:hypothetical protein
MLGAEVARLADPFITIYPDLAALFPCKFGPKPTGAPEIAGRVWQMVPLRQEVCGPAPSLPDRWIRAKAADSWLRCRKERDIVAVPQRTRH